MTDLAIQKYDRPLTVPVGDAQHLAMLLSDHASDYAALIPAATGLSPARLQSAFMEIADENPQVLQCTAMSILKTIKTAADLGLSFSKTLGQIYAIPRRNSKKGVIECQPQLGYQGRLSLIHRAAGVKMMHADAVFEGDSFDYVQGRQPPILHKPNFGVPRDWKHLTHVYCVATFEEGLADARVEPKAWIEKVRACAQKQDIWNAWPVPMAIKSIIHLHGKYLPVSAEYARRIDLANQIDQEEQGLRLASPATSGDRLAALKARVLKMEVLEGGSEIAAESSTADAPPKGTTPLPAPEPLTPAAMRAAITPLAMQLGLGDKEAAKQIVAEASKKLFNRPAGTVRPSDNEVAVMYEYLTGLSQKAVEREPGEEEG